MFSGTSPSSTYFALTPSNTGYSPFRALYVGTTGNVQAVREHNFGNKGTVAVTAGTIAANAVLTVPSGHGLLAFDVIRLSDYAVSSGTVWTDTGSGLYTLSAVAATTVTVQGLASTGFGTLTSALIYPVGKSVLFTAVPVGVLDVEGLRVDSTGTGASTIVGL